MMRSVSLPFRGNVSLERIGDEDDRKKGFGDHKRDGKRPFSKPIKPIKRRGYDDYED